MFTARYELLFWRNSPPVGQGLLTPEDSRSHTTTHHTRYDSSGRVIGPSQRPIPKKQHSQQISKSPAGFEPANPAKERPQAHALDRAVTRTGNVGSTTEKIKKVMRSHDGL